MSRLFITDMSCNVPHSLYIARAPHWTQFHDVWTNSTLLYLSSDMSSTPHLFLILSLMSVYIVFVFLLMFVRSFGVRSSKFPLSPLVSLVSCFLCIGFWFELCFSVALCLAILIATFVFGPWTNFHVFTWVFVCLSFVLNKTCLLFPPFPALWVWSAFGSSITTSLITRYESSFFQFS